MRNQVRLAEHFGSSSYFAMDLYPGLSVTEIRTNFFLLFFIKCQTPCTWFDISGCYREFHEPELVTRFSPIVSSPLENPLPLSALPLSISSPPLPSYCLRVKQKLHRWRCRPTLDMGSQLFSSTSKRLSTRSCDFHACKRSIHFRLPLGRIAWNYYTLAKRTIDRLLHDTYKVFVIGWQSGWNRDFWQSRKL